METTSFSDDIRRYLALIWHWAWLLALATILAAGTAYLVSKRTTPVYQASTTLLINEAPANKSADYTSVLTSERLTQTYAQLLTKQPVLQGVIQRLNLSISPDGLKKAIAVQPVRDTQLIEVSVEDIDPSRAADVANALVTEFADQNQAIQASRYASSKESLKAQLDDLNQQIQANNDALNSLQNGSDTLSERDRLEANQAQYRQMYAYLLQSYEQVRLAEAQSTSNIVQVEPAMPPRSPIRPRTMVNTALAGVMGLMLAVGSVFLIEALDDTVRNPDEITRQLGLPVLGLIASHEIKEANLIAVDQPRSPISEAFRSLRTNIKFASVDVPLRTILITSPTPEDGKSTIAANLGVILAQSGHSVALVDADLRRPRVHKMIGLSNRQGLSELFVQSRVVVDGTLQSTEIPGFSALTSGPLPPNPAELLGSEKMFEILNQVRDRVDVVIIDSPPILAVTDAVVLAPRVDGVLLVIKPGRTKLVACKQAVDQLRRINANILGVVLNDVEVKRAGYKYAYYKGYYYTNNKYYGDNSSGRKKSKTIGDE